MGEGPLHPTYRTPTKELRAAHIAQGGLKRAQTSRGELRTAQESSGQPMAAQGGRKRAQTSRGDLSSLTSRSKRRFRIAAPTHLWPLHKELEDSLLFKKKGRPDLGSARASDFG